MAILLVLSPIFFTIAIYPDSFSLSWNQGRGGFLFAGAFLAAELIGLKFAIPLTFLAVVVNDLRKLDHIFIMLVSGFASLILYDAPFKSYIILSPIIALLAALMMLRIKK